MTGTWHQLMFPSDLDRDGVVQFLRTLAIRPRRGAFGHSAPVVFEVYRTAHSMRWLLGLTDEASQGVLDQLRTALPTIRTAEVVARELPGIERAVELRLSTHRRPLRSDERNRQDLWIGRSR